MAENPAQDYGLDLACVVDANELFDEAEGIEVVMQDALHVITQEDFLGPGGDGRGIDVRKFIGARQDVLTSNQPLVAAVLERDDRITRADVVLTAITTKGLADIRMDITCFTDEGPFRLTKNVSDLMSADFGGGGSVSFFDDAIAGTTLTAVRSTVLGYLQAAALRVSNWRIIGVGRQMFEAYVASTQGFVSSQSTIVRGFVSLDTSTDPGDVDAYDPNNQNLPAAPGFLSAMGANTFSTVRESASFATGFATLVNDGPGARVLSPNAVIWTWTEGTPPDPPPTYINVDDATIYTDNGTVTVPAGTSIDLPVKCQVIGAIGSCPASSLSLTTTLVGCTATNAAAIIGSDREDAATYRQNCRQAMARLSLGGPADAYTYLATKNLDGTVLLNDSIPPVPTSITRTQVTQDSATGIVNAYYASGSGAAIPDDITAAVRNTKFNAFAVPDAITFTGFAAAPQTIHVIGTAKIKAKLGITAQAVAEGLVAKLIELSKTIPVGGMDQVAGAGVVYTDDLEAFARAGYPGVYAVHVSTPVTTSTPLLVGQVAVIQSDPGDGIGSADWTITVVP